jgi:hypothetical protein
MRYHDSRSVVLIDAVVVRQRHCIFELRREINPGHVMASQGSELTDRMIGAVEQRERLSVVAVYHSGFL